MVLLIPGGLKVHIEGLWKRIKEFKELSCLVKVEGSPLVPSPLPLLPGTTLTTEKGRPSSAARLALTSPRVAGAPPPPPPLAAWELGRP